MPAALHHAVMKAGGNFWLEVFVCNHVRFPGRRRLVGELCVCGGGVTSDFSSRC